MDRTTMAFHPTTPGLGYNNSSTATQTMGFTTAAILKASAVAVLIIVAIIGNILVCISFTVFRSLRSLTNYFIVSLSISDILIATFTMPIWLGVQLHQPQRWPVDRTLNKIWHAMDLLLCLGSVLSLTAISVERNLAITNPFYYTKCMSPKRVLIVIVCLWLYAITISAVTLVNPFVKYTSLALFIVITTYVLPVFTLFTMYAQIFIVARRQTRRLRQEGALAKDMKAVKTIAIVVGAYIVCYTPFFVVLIWIYFALTPRIAPTTISIARWLTYLNSCLNPIIYSCFNKTYRKSFKRLFKDWGRRIQEFRVKLGAKKATATSRLSIQNSRMSLNITMHGSAGSLLDGPKTSTEMISLGGRSRGSLPSTQAAVPSSVVLNGLISKVCYNPQGSPIHEQPTQRQLQIN